MARLLGTHPLRRLLLLTGAGLALGVIAVGVGGAWAGRATPTSDAAVSADPSPGYPTTSWSPTSVSTSGLPGGAAIAPLPATSDPAVYAAAIAGVVFGMDTRTQTPSDYFALLTAARPPDAAELIPGLTDEAFAAALAERIPDDYMWDQMRDSAQWATFTPERVWEPDYIAQKRATGDLPAGVAGLNVTGTQTLHYLDENDQPAVRDRTQSVSVLVVCAPVQQSCGLVAVSTGVVE